MPNKKIKTLLILSPGFPENEDDSTCIPPQQIFVKALKEVNPGLNIVVLAFQYPFFSGEYQWHDIKIISFGNPGNGRLSRFFIAYRVSLALKRLNRDYELIGLLSFWLGKCAFIGNKFAKKYRLKHYSWLLGQDVKPGNKYFYKIDPDDSSLIAISDFTAQNLNNNYHILPRHIIPVGIDTALFNDPGVLRHIDILGAGSLIPLKQYDVFLEAILSLKKYIPNIKAVICGDGPEMKRLQKMIMDMNLNRNVTIIGRISHNEVLKLMQQSKIFLHTSNFEGFSTVCLEALYAGAKVISIVKPMNFDIKNWHIVNDKDQMTELIKDILRDAKIKYEPVVPYLVQDSAKAILSLFG